MGMKSQKRTHEDIENVPLSKCCRRIFIDHVPCRFRLIIPILAVSGDDAMLVQGNGNGVTRDPVSWQWQTVNGFDPDGVVAFGAPQNKRERTYAVGELRGG
jgi:hypothetical protein